MKELFLCLFLLSSVVYGQQVVILDSLSKEPIPLVHVFDGKKGVVTSPLGVFYWEKSHQKEHLTLSCLGYATKKIDGIKDTLYMLPKAVELMPVVVSNRSLSVNEIIDSVKENTAKNYDFGLSSSEVFIVSESTDEFLNMSIDINKSTIPELDQMFIDSILQNLPQKESGKFYSKSRWLRDSGGLKYHKLQVLQAATLVDSLTENRFASIEKTIDDLLKKRVKKDSYFKVKSGAFVTVKMNNDFHQTDSVNKTTPEINPKQYAKRILGGLQRLAQTEVFEQQKWVLPFLKDSDKYRFEIEGIVYDLGVPTYKIHFGSKKKKAYSGYLWVDVEDFGVYKITYNSNHHESRFKLLGLFYEERLNNKEYLFVKNHLNTYVLHYINTESQTLFGLKRPITIIEKNKVVKGRNRQNKLSIDVNSQVKNTSQRSVYFNSFTPITKREFDVFIPTHHVVPKDFYSMTAIEHHIQGLPID